MCWRAYCCVYLQSSVSLLYTLAKFLKHRVFFLRWILQELTAVLLDSKQTVNCRVITILLIHKDKIELEWS